MTALYLIKWGNEYSEGENPGATIRFMKYGDVSFGAPLMSSGLALKSWYMRAPYLARRKSPSLPLLKSGQSYDIRLVSEVEPEASVQIVIEFSDENEDVLSTVYINEKEGSFDYPEEAYSYKVQLVNKNNASLVFKYLLLSESDFNENYALQADDENALFFLTPLKDKDKKGKKESELVISRGNRFTRTLLAPSQKEGSRIYYFATESEDFTQEMDKLCRYIKKKDLSKIKVSRGRLFVTLPQEYASVPQVLKERLPQIEITYDDSVF